LIGGCNCKSFFSFGVKMPRKSPWTQTDVQGSVEGLRHAPRALIDDPLERIAQSRSNLAEFWAANGEGFRAMWTGISRRDRAMLVQTNCPHLARSVSDRTCACGCGVDMTGASTLIPEMFLDRLVLDGGEGSLPDVMHRHATADPREQEHADLLYLRQCHRPVQNPSKMHMLMDIAGLRRGQCMDIKHAGALPGVARMFETGVAVDDVLFDRLVHRQLALLGTLCAYADEYATEWTKVTNVYAVSAAMWAAPGWQDKTQEELIEDFNRLQTATRSRRAHPGTGGAASSAAELKAQGNERFADGDNRGARRLYSRAIDALHRSCSCNASLSLEAATLLHTCLSNRAQCSLNLRQATAAQADAEYALTLVAAGVPERLVEKTRFRQQQAAEAIAAQLRAAERRGSGGGGGGGGATESGRECSVCLEVKGANGFSRKQWRAKADSRKCLLCAEGGGPAAAAASPPPPAPPPADPAAAPDVGGGGQDEGRRGEARRERGADGRMEVANGTELLAAAVECGVFESEECPICLLDWHEVACRVVIPPCSHPVCSDCLGDWCAQLQQQRGPAPGGGEPSACVCTLCKVSFDAGAPAG